MHFVDIIIILYNIQAILFAVLIEFWKGRCLRSYSKLSMLQSVSWGEYWRKQFNLLASVVPNSYFRTSVIWAWSLKHETIRESPADYLKASRMLEMWCFSLLFKGLLADLHMHHFRVTSNTAQFRLSFLWGTKVRLLTYIGAGVSGSMERYVLNVYSCCCSLYVLCKHHVAMGVYLALDTHTYVRSTQGFMSTIYGTFTCQSVWKLLAKRQDFLPSNNTISNFVLWDKASKYN